MNYITLAFAVAQSTAEMLRNTSVLRWPQTKGNKISIGCITPAFLGARKWGEMPPNPWFLGGPQSKGDKISIGYINPTFLGAKKSAEWLRLQLPPLILLVGHSFFGSHGLGPFLAPIKRTFLMVGKHNKKDEYCTDAKPPLEQGASGKWCEQSPRL